MRWWHPLFFFYFAAVISAASSGVECFCGYRRSGLLLMLRCVSQAPRLPKHLFHPVICHRMGDLVRIGDFNEDNSSNLAIEAYGLSELVDLSISRLQLNLPLNTKMLDALSFAGLTEVKVLQAFRTPLALDSCSLAGLSKLENIILNCSSSFDHFLTFGSAFKSIRLIGCRDLPIQFVCTKCSQQPEINVLRVLPGPPSMVDRVSFEINSEEASLTSLVMDQCLPGVCSDQHLCRDDYALSLAVEFNENKIKKESPTTNLQTTSQTETTIEPAIMSAIHPLIDTGPRKYILLSIILPITLLVFLIASAVCVSILVKICSSRSRHPQHHSISANGIAMQSTEVAYNPMVNKL